MLFRKDDPQRRDNIVEKKNYRDYRIPLREDFNCRCGYCNDRDIPRVEYFEIDHLVPQKIMKKKRIMTIIIWFMLAILVTMQKERNGQVVMRIFQL